MKTKKSLIKVLLGVLVGFVPIILLVISIPAYISNRSLLALIVMVIAAVWLVVFFTTKSIGFKNAKNFSIHNHDELSDEYTLSEVHAKYSFLKTNIINLWNEKMHNANTKAEKRLFRHEKFLALNNNDHEWQAGISDVTNNKLIHMRYGIRFALLAKIRRTNDFVRNFGFNRYVNNKRVFTASMAGEIWWQKLGINTVRGIFLAFMGIIVIFPFYWMLSISFRTSTEIQEGVTGMLPIWPKEWSIQAYSFLFNNPSSKVAVGQYIRNSFLIAGISTVTQITVSLFAGYGLSQYNTRGKEWLIIIMLSTMMLPGEALLIGQYIFATKINMQNTIFALFVPFIGNAFTIFLFKNAFDTLNDSIKKAAKIDGLSRFKFFWKVAIPLVRSTIFTATLMSFIGSWNSVLWPTMVLKSNSEWVTLPMLLWQIMNSTGDVNGIWNTFPDGTKLQDPQNLKMAGAVVAILPMFIIFLFTKKYLVRGITRNSGSKE
ncbi:carbohydrate ABC transporter permease [Mesoplasma seiffertii]|uniref:carbohydrate ABC transporter permease n=1 Tax=Mesoplasma seiffertii TaxID=28224 RepID=UPI00047CFB00|nr:carbohydrate ABC transporter permease [Mesoplasma seiffertii]